MLSLYLPPSHRKENMREKWSSPTPTAASIPAFFRPPPHRSPQPLFAYVSFCVFYLLISLLSTLRSFQIPSFSSLSSCCLTPPCGSVEGGAVLVMSRQECSRYRRSRKGGGASLQTSGFMKLRTGRKLEMKSIWRFCQEPDWCGAEEYQHHLAAVC